MATVEDIQHLVAQMEQSLSAKFEEIDDPDSGTSTTIPTT